MQTLFHGTTSSIAKKIKDGGFKLTKGKRSGFMGIEKEIDNLAIFLSDNKSLARAYGSNRDPHDGRDTDVVEVKADIGNILNMTKWNTAIPLELRKIGLKLISEHEGRNIKKPVQEDIFWLIDQKPFVSEIQNMNYDSVLFSESRATRKALGGVDGNTIAIFNPKKTHILRNPIINLNDLYEYSKS